MARILSVLAAVGWLVPVSPALAQGAVFASLEAYDGEIVMVPLAFDIDPAANPVTQWTDEHGTFHAEWVPPGETAEAWTQMQVLRGFEGLRRNNPDALPTALSRAMRVQTLTDYIRACATAPLALPVDIPAVAGTLDQTATFIGCPSDNGSATSGFEVVVVTMLGESHAYWLSWEARSVATGTIPEAVPEIWHSRAAFLAQAAICPEGADYPHCP